MKLPPRPAEHGVGRLTALVFVLIVGALSFAAYNIVPFYYYNFELINQMEALVATADRNNDAVLRKKIGAVMKALEIPAEERDVQIDRRDGVISMSVAYQEIFYVRWGGKDYDIYAFPFRASVSGAF